MTRPDAMTNDEIVVLLRELLNRQPASASRSLPDSMNAAVRDFAPEDLAALRPYVVGMRQGRWDTGGIFNSTPGDVDAIFGEHAEAAMASLGEGKKLKFVFYAHGGLVPEKAGLAQARFHIDWWKQSAADGIYPIYFVWKTGLGETIAQLLGLSGGVSRDLQATAREWISDPVVAAIARRLGGEAMWSGMKRDAEQAVLPGAAATYVAHKLKEFCDRHRGRVELHAVGHSAGSVFHSHFIPLSTVTGNPYFTTTSFMAPAVRVDAFLKQLTMIDGGRLVLKPEIGRFSLFTMKKDFEKRDNCMEIYRQSLLYLIFHAFEDVNPTPILGLEESLRGDNRLAQLMGLGGAAAVNAEVIWSKTAAVDSCSATQATSHGGFSSDGPTMDSILRRILNRCAGEAIHHFPQPRALDAMWDIWAQPDDLPGFAPGAPAPSATVFPSPPPAPLRNNNGVGKRKALCVGIDAYAAPNRLTGCVNDANAWATFLTANQFDTRTLLDRDASYDAFMAALRGLVQSSSAGDVLAMTYSGHGTTVPDLTGRTVDGVEEAMVPADFSLGNPKLLMDFDLAAVFDTLPAGVGLTCFIDCCHSGTILRMFVGMADAGAAAADERARYIVLSPGEIAAVQEYRTNFAAEARGNVAGGQERMKEVAFAACRPDEVAWESGGQGAFTRVAVELLQNGFAGMSNEQFQAAVTRGFGAAPRQHPNLDCAAAVKGRGLLQPM